MVKSEIYFYNWLNRSHLQALFILLLLSFILSSCKIFKSNKSTNTSSNTKNNTHTHTTISSYKVDELIDFARSFTGVPYRSGGLSNEGFDCSGLMFTVCKNAGLILPRISYQQAEVGDEIAIEQIKKGDFLFFKTSKNSNQISHVGMVTQVEQPSSITFIHASTSKGVREDNLFSEYWKKSFAKATRPFVF